MNGSRVATSSLGAAIWLVVSATMLIWVAFALSAILHMAVQKIAEALTI